MTHDVFPKMNPEELFLYAKVFSHKIEKHHNMKTPYRRVYTYLWSMLSDFATIDVEIHPILQEKLDLPPLEPLHFITGGIQEMNLRDTSNPDFGLIF